VLGSVVLLVPRFVVARYNGQAVDVNVEVGDVQDCIFVE